MNALAVCSGRLYTGCRDTVARVFDVESGVLIYKLTGHDNSIRSLNTDGHILCTGGKDKTVKIWSCDTGLLLASRDGHDDWINNIKIDKGVCYTGSRDCTARAWSQTSEGYDNDKKAVFANSRVNFEVFGLPVLEASLGWFNILLEWLQMIAFAFMIGVDWSMDHPFYNLDIFQLKIDLNAPDLYARVYGSVVMVAVLFIILFGLSFKTVGYKKISRFFDKIWCVFMT